MDNLNDTLLSLNESNKMIIEICKNLQHQVDFLQYQVTMLTVRVKTLEEKE